MCRRLSVFLVFLCLMGLLLSSPCVASAGDAKSSEADRALCQKMLRFGLESYHRGRYLDAKEHFRKAIQADPSSAEAWRFYDQSVIFAVAEKAEKDVKMTQPDVSTRQEAPQKEAAPATPPAAPPAAAPPAGTPSGTSPAPEKKKPGFKVIEDEGC